MINEQDAWLGLSPSEFLDKWYESQYLLQSYSGSQAKIQRIMHQSLEAGRDDETHHSVLEIGANSGEHLEFVKHEYQRYVLSDLRHPPKELIHEIESNSKIEFIVADAHKLPFSDGEFDRVLMTCVLHHLSDPEKALSEVYRVTKTGGKIDIFLPSDPGLLFRFAKTLGPLRKAKKSGLYEVKRLVDARDHINHAFGLTQILKQVSRNAQLVKRTYPLPNLPLDLSLWTIFRITKSHDEIK